MFPYQIYQALADQHIRDLTAEARRHELIAAVRRSAALSPSPTPSRLKAAVARAASHVQLGWSARTRSTAPARSATRSVSPSTSASASASARQSGPMGCLA
jgi:hypothetical protein